MQGLKADAPEKTGTMAAEGGPHPPQAAVGAEPCTANGAWTKPEAERLMEAVVERGNVELALKRVQGNAGAAGVDGMTTAELEAHCRTSGRRSSR